MRSSRCAAGGLGLALLLASLCAACGTRSVRETVFKEGRTEVRLRHELAGGEPVDKGYGHPVTIAPVRMAHILSALDVRTEAKKGSQRMPAIPLELLYTVADGVSAALAKANPSQQAVVLSVRAEKRWGLFDHKYLTSFVTYVKDDYLYIHVARIEWEVPERKDDRLPEPRVGERVMSFRVLPDDAMVPVDDQSVAVAWRDDRFKRPTRTRVLPSGKVVRRTILMESPEQEPPPVSNAPALPEDLSPADLRELADLEEERRSGQISEAEYDLRRREILERESER